MIRRVITSGILVLSLAVLAVASAAEQPPYEINAITSQTGAAAFIGQGIVKTLGVVEAGLANAHLRGVELGSSYREVVPLVLVLLLVALRPPREAVTEVE